jgi:hypothetical protein
VVVVLNANAMVLVLVLVLESRLERLLELEKGKKG